MDPDLIIVRFKKVLAAAVIGVSFFGGGWASATPYLDSSFGLLKSDTTLVNELLEKGDRAILAGDLSLAEEYINRADSIAKKIGFSKGQEMSIGLLAEVYINRQETELAVSLLNEAIERFPESEKMVQYHNLLGRAYDMEEKPLKAIASFQTAIEFTERLPQNEKERLRIGLTQNLAVIYNNLGQRNKAFKNYLSTIEYAEATGDTLMLAVVYNNVGKAYNDYEEYGRAVYYLERSLDFAQAKNAKADIYRAHLNLANTLSNMERYEEALNHYEVAERLFFELRPNSPPAIILHNRGATLAKMGQYENAEELLKQSLAMSEAGGITEGMYYNHYVLGNMYMEQQRSEEAIRHLEAAEELAVRSLNTDLVITSRENLYKAYAQANRYEDAFTTLNTHKAYSDSLTDIEKEKELAKLENQLELNRQNEVNRLLQEKQSQQESKLQFQFILIVAAMLIIVLIVVILFIMRKTAREKEEILTQVRAQKEELEQLNRDKDKLFAIIAHDLRTPLSSMQGVLYLFKEKALSEEEMEKVVQELEISVQKNVDVMEDLLVWAKEQLSGVKMDFGPVQLQPLVKDIISSQKILADKKGISIIQNIEEGATLKADSNALQLVIRNLLLNGIKYTNQGGSIEIGTQETREKVIIYIKDTGIGIPKEAFDKIFDSKSWTREGTNKEKGSGFGLSLSKEFVERMNGKIWFESEEGIGTTFFIELPTNS
ncbi:MAG: tetratricopeptide repeat protein [Gracilimonas sp.]|uniref:ATP-binding protein n=1 Tax=Gracilimonas sp. TaxID=1974203 RepID=UPI0019A292B5|nr:tetratricopeptide repeat protein [Gracilimonas sp.]MBD3616492.1 tetratricopeptide repeat protein [Gracilimonas sp.]